ncbi:MAG: toxin-antitoxin system HicB family antitoxin [Acidimicrobiales bacterium]
MKMSLVAEGFRADVLAVGELGDETVADVADRIAAIVARSAAGRIMDVLSEVTAEISAGLPGGRVEIHLVGDDVEFAYVDDRPPATETDGDLSSRITLRLPERLKLEVEASASSESLSVNSWILRALERGTSATKDRNRRVGSRLHGYGTS